MTGLRAGTRTTAASERLFAAAQRVLAGRGQQPGTRVPRGWWHAAVHRPGRGRVSGRRGRQPLPGPGSVLGPAHPGARSSGSAGGGDRGGGAGNYLRRADRARGPPRGASRRHLPVDRDGPIRQLRHRGGDERRPPGSRCHRANRHREVRRLLSRPRRSAPGRGRLRGRDPWPARLPRRDSRHGGRHVDRAVQRPRGGGGGLRREGR